MKLSLQNSVYSTQDLRSMIMEVRRYASWFAQNSIKNKVTGTVPKESLVISDAAASLIREVASAQSLSKAVLDELLTSLEELQAKSPRMTITLAAVPGNNLKMILVDWCRKNVAPSILVDFRFNATLLGGMVVQYGSHVYDWSFRRQILASRDKFPEVLRNV